MKNYSLKYLSFLLIFIAIEKIGSIIKSARTLAGELSYKFKHLESLFFYTQRPHYVNSYCFNLVCCKLTVD